eukprot:g42678.t1
MMVQWQKTAHGQRIPEQRMGKKLWRSRSSESQSSTRGSSPGTARGLRALEQHVGCEPRDSTRVARPVTARGLRALGQQAGCEPQDSKSAASPVTAHGLTWAASPGTVRKLRAPEQHAGYEPWNSTLAASPGTARAFVQMVMANWTGLLPGKQINEIGQFWIVFRELILMNSGSTPTPFLKVIADVKSYELQGVDYLDREAHCIYAATFMTTRRELWDRVKPTAPKCRLKLAIGFAKSQENLIKRPALILLRT